MIFDITDKSRGRKITQKQLIELVDSYFDYFYDNYEDEVKFGVMIAEMQALLLSQVRISLQQKFVHFNDVKIEHWTLDERAVAINSLVNIGLPNLPEQKFKGYDKAPDLTFRPQAIDAWLESSVVCVFAEFGYFMNDLVTDSIIISLKKKTVVLGKERSVAEQIAMKLMQNLYRAVAIVFTLVNDAKIGRLLQKQRDEDLEQAVKKLIESKAA